ncbi:unnamed protein product [Peronospora belbahrii]|uniref:Uncharacterized protein n=1 Tax=Peronospora belbahrii TaxID=622444 RepID=A0ABN8D709_9STRA|nr:unnamed protein product [Peronospora belbahrii]
MHRIDNQPTTRTLRRLSHGLVMDLKQAVQLEKQELKKMGLSIEVDMTQLKVASAEKDKQSKDYTTLPHWLYRPQRLATTGKYSGCPPCSPPVPIPQNHEAQRRYSATGDLGEPVTHGVDPDELQTMSTSHCHAKNIDELWDYNMLTESRESFEASCDQVKQRSRNNKEAVDGTAREMTLLKYGSDSSMASTVKSVNENDEDLDEMVGPEEDEQMLHYGDVFVMEDL